MTSMLARSVAMLLLFGACFPQLLAGVLVLGSLQGEHELRCQFGNHRVEITLHHQRASGTSGVARGIHRHTMVEKLLVGSGVSDDEPDHRWIFDRQHVLLDDDESRDQELGWVACHEAGCIEFIRLATHDSERTTSGFSGVVAGGLSPPLAMRRGVVMRL